MFVFLNFQAPATINGKGLEFKCRSDSGFAPIYIYIYIHSKNWTSASLKILERVGVNHSDNQVLVVSKTMVFKHVLKNETENQHPGISIRSLRTWICLNDLQISMNPIES
jgi:hypothetical protein